MIRQNHLSFLEQVNLGAYYTPPRLAEAAFALIHKHIPDALGHTLLDTSCGYGAFLKGGFRRIIGGDIDPLALAEAEKTGAELFQCNGLASPSRAGYSIGAEEKLIIIGNPPYNDATSQVRKNLKEGPASVDANIKRRDLGLSFLLSYGRLSADYLCVLHPLSYLIKKSNFARLEPFTRCYRLLDALLVSSGEFSATSRRAAFPIAIALYKRGKGMDYAHVQNFSFSAGEGKAFSPGHWDTLASYAPKYPSRAPLKETAYFWTMRDINALRRNRTFLERPSAQAIRVPEGLLPYYCYADAFKRRLAHVPYYLGNCDVPIRHEAFFPLKNYFLAEAKQHHPYLPIPPARTNPKALDLYFESLLGKHYLA